MSKRANGEGTIFQRADGRWVTQTYVLCPDGFRRRRTVYGRTRTEVKDKLAALIAETAKGVPAEATSWTVESYCRHWLADIAPHRVRASTLASYRYAIEKHIVPAIGGKRLHKLTTADVRSFVARVRASPGRAGRPLSDRTVQFAYATLRLVLNRAVREEIINRNVAALVDAPRVVRHEIVPWTPEEVRQFLTASRDHRLYALFAVGVAVGMRRGELLALRWSDVDLEERTIRITRTLQRVAGVGLVEGPTKTQRSRRVVCLPEVSAAALRRHKATQSAERLHAVSWPEVDRVFTTSVGTSIEPRNLVRTFELLVAAAGVRRIRFHDLRHTCATLLLAQGVPMRVVMEVLGHSQIAVTMDTYSHVLPEMQRVAAASMDQALGS